MLALLEIPVLCFVIAPGWTRETIERTNAWIRPRRRQFAVTALTLLGALLLIKGSIELLS